MKNFFSFFIIFILLLVPKLGGSQESLDGWIQKESHIAREKLLQNISPSDAVRGVVIASPSKENPNYYYHWVRDAALVMDVVTTLYEKASNPTERLKYFNLLMDYVSFSRSNQETKTLTGLGEPKFNVDGSAFNDPWGRPQDDGPALRAIALIHFANLLLTQGQIVDFVKRKLYDGQFPTSSIIKADLEYVSHNWQNTSFDVWEEVKGHHFYTRMVQRKALLQGANLADRLGDRSAAEWYRTQAYLLQNQIKNHWNPQKEILVATLDRDGGLDYKTSGLDVTSILAILHGKTEDGFLPATDGRVLATAFSLQESFRKIYPINQRENVPGVAIGRYPEDQYDGTPPLNGGHPWVLTTLAFAELYFRVADEFEKQGVIEITQLNAPFLKSVVKDEKTQNKLKLRRFSQNSRVYNEIISSLREKGNDFLRRVQYHANPDGSLSEQINKETGFLESARDLTWNYAAFLTAIDKR